jgi:hypothetical protein
MDEEPLKKSEFTLKVNKNSARIITKETKCMQMAWQMIGRGRHWQPGVS